MDHIDNGIRKLDQKSLWFLALPIWGIFMSYYFLLGKNVVFEINDVLDESLFNYVLQGKYLFHPVKVFPEMLTGVPASGMSVSSPIFVPLYHFFPVFTAFMIQFSITALTAFLGMYACVRKLTGSSFMGVIAGTALMWLPWNPIYGLSQIGIPLLLYAFLCLLEIKRVSLKVALPFCMILYYTFGAHLVWIGFAPAIILGFLTAVFLIRKRAGMAPFYWGVGLFGASYVLINKDLFVDFFGGTDFVSHRTESIIDGSGFGTAWGLFWYGDTYAPSLHHYLILPIALLLVIYGLRLTIFRKHCFGDAPAFFEKTKRLYVRALLLFVGNIVIALIYGLCESRWIIDWRNAQTGILKFFQFKRIYWLYLATWYIDGALALMLPAIYHSGFRCRGEDKREQKYEIAGGWPQVCIWGMILMLCLPTAWYIRQNSNWILNKSQYKNHCNVGLVSWKDFYAEDLMKQIKDYIGKPQETYHVASLGISPAVSLEAGFYTIDGYSNSYFLDYKHRFRPIIEKELEKSDYYRTYFDTWGNRCYIVAAEGPGNLGRKNPEFVYRNLELNTSAMKKLGCDYLLSAAEIEGAEQRGFVLQSVFEQEDSFYRIWLYSLKE
ncbi:MAG: DUF6044 family protein [Lachnospiraceae bacterium]|nr:DUF6044 family protein [Lachnospiraceae bacterium]